MSRIPTPKTIEDAPAGSQDALNAVKKSLGSAPNLFRIVANSPAALNGYLDFKGALGKGVLDPVLAERLALVVGEYNGCDYCVAAHTYLGENVAKLSRDEIINNRKGGSTDAKADAAVRFAQNVVKERGHVSDADVQNLIAAGYSNEELVEIVAHVALNTLTNYLNSVLDTEVDFPAADKL